METGFQINWIMPEANKITGANAGGPPRLPIRTHRAARIVSSDVSCDMKLHSVLLGGTKVLTESCVSPQVFHGGMRLTGCGREAATVRGVKPSRQWSNPGSLKLGDALESADRVKALNARKHRHQE